MLPEVKVEIGDNIPMLYPCVYKPSSQNRNARRPQDKICAKRGHCSLMNLQGCKFSIIEYMYDEGLMEE